MSDLAFILSATPIFGDTYTMEVPNDRVWMTARAHDLTEADYGRTWFVYDSKQDYLDSLD